MEMFRILALDYGEKRIGIALSDQMRTFSKPFSVLANNDGLWDELRNIINSQNVKQIVIGLPLNFEGKDTKKTSEIRNFSTELKKRIPLPCSFVNESFTSQDANQMLKQLGYSIKDSRKVIDKVAAALILKNYLEQI